jgi:MFS transporter, DHA1 family, tetracycline resistance protein
MTLEPIARKSASRFILLTVFIYSAGFGIIMPALPSLIQELANVSLSEATRIGAWIGAAYGIFQFLMGPMIGNLGDRFGRRPVFLISLAAFGTDFLLMGLAPSVAWLFVGRSIAGGLGAIFGPANAAMADISTAEDRAASFGRVGAAFGLGFIIGPAVGGFLADWGTRLPFYVAGAAALSNCLYGYFAFPETMPQENRRPLELKRANPLGAILSIGTNKNVLPIASLYFLWLVATNIYPASWSFFAQAQYGWDTRMVGISLTITGISMVVGQAILVRRAVARFGERRTAQIGMAFGCLLFGLYALNGLGWIALFMALASGLQNVTMPSLNAMMSRRVPPGQQGELQGLNTSLAALAILIANILYNNVLSAFTGPDAVVHFPGAIFLIACGIATLTLLGLLRLPPANDGNP